MTKRDYFNVAYGLRICHPREIGSLDIGSDLYADRVSQWETDVVTLASVFYREYPNFNRALFLAAAGWSIRPDGSQWTVDWGRNIVRNFRSV